MYRRILVPIDGSLTSNRGLNEAIELARDQGAKLRLIHLVDEYVGVSGAEGVMVDTRGLMESLRQGGKKIIDKAEALARRNGLTPESVMLESFEGRAADFIVEQADKWRANLIVLGTHGRRDSVDCRGNRRPATPCILRHLDCIVQGPRRDPDTAARGFNDARHANRGKLKTGAQAESRLAALVSF